MMSGQIELVFDYPASIAKMLLTDEIDLGLVPVAVIPAMTEYHIVSDYCIGADGEVASVCLFSEVPLHRIERVILDYQSRTSVALAKILIREYWKIKPLLVPATADFSNSIRGTTAALVIGDRALEQRKISPYIYDLAEAWKHHTGLPFVFAAWISNKTLAGEFIQQFNAANRYGLDRINEVVAANAYPVFDLTQYFTRCIRYELDDEKRRGLALFVDMLSQGEG